MSLSSSLAVVLKQYQALSQQLLVAVEADARSLAAGEGAMASNAIDTRRQILPELNLSLQQLRKHRELWQQMSPTERSQENQIGPMLRTTQDALMKIILRDRENEQTMLRAGTVPARHVGRLQTPPKPHFVADLYRRHGDSSTASRMK